MTGLLSILLLMLLPQAGILPGQTGVLPGLASTEPTSGWEVDQRSQKFTFIVQIPPNAIGAFAQGPTGNELPVPIENRLIGRVEQIAIRFDTKELPKTDPPNLPSRSQASTQPSIQNLALMRYAPQTLAGPSQWESMVGWQFDNKTNRYAYVIQIPVASLQQFMSGPNGQELIVPVHPDVVDFVEQVTIRVGNGGLPKEAAPQSVLAKYQVMGDDGIRPLGGGSSFGSPVSIDPTPVSGGSDLGQQRSAPGAILPNDPGPSSFPGTLDGGLPRTGTSAGLSTNNMNSLNNGAPGSPLSPNFSQPRQSDLTNLDSARRANERDLMPTNNTNRNRLAESVFGRSDSTTQTAPAGNRFANNTDPRSLNGDQNFLSGQQDRGYSNVSPNNMAPQLSNPQYASTMNPGYPQMASNPQPQYTPSGFGNIPTSAVVNPNAQSTLTPLPIPGGVPGQVSAPNNLNQQQTLTPEKKSLGFNWALAALVLLGFNIYQFFWMSNARTKFRQMVLSKRSTRLEPTA